MLIALLTLFVSRSFASGTFPTAFRVRNEIALILCRVHPDDVELLKQRHDRRNLRTSMGPFQMRGGATCVGGRAQGGGNRGCGCHYGGALLHDAERNLRGA